VNIRIVARALVVIALGAVALRAPGDLGGTAVAEGAWCNQWFCGSTSWDCDSYNPSVCIDWELCSEAWKALCVDNAASCGGVAPAIMCLTEP